MKIFYDRGNSKHFSEGVYQLIEAVDLGKISDSVSEESKLKVKEAIYNKIHKMILQSDISGIVSRETEKIIRAKVKGGVISSIVLSDEITGKIAAYVGHQVEAHVVQNDLEILFLIFTKQSAELKEKNLMQLIQEAGVEKEVVLATLKKGYVRFMTGAKERIAESFHIKQFVYDRVMELDPGKIEFLVNEAIKREMDYLVYLGGFQVFTASLYFHLMFVVLGRNCLKKVGKGRRYGRKTPFFFVIIFSI